MKTSAKIILTGLILLLSISVYYAKSVNIKTLFKPADIDTDQQASQLKEVYDEYFSLKDAFVETDIVKTTAGAKNLHKAIDAVKTEKLSAKEQSVWKDLKKDMTTHTGHIEKLKTIEEQRLHFSLLTESMYKLMKASNHERPVYYQLCPMYNDDKGGYWLSKESKIRNPYFGAQMPTCGKTVETLK